MFASGANPDFVVPEEMLLRNIPELLTAPPGLEDLHQLFPENPLDAQAPQEAAPGFPKTAVSSVALSASTSVPQAIAPRNWYMIPQRVFDYGRKQWKFTPSEGVSFKVDGFPGMNMRKALEKKFEGLVGQDDIVLQDAKKAASCRLLVRFS